jgi:hypothetical protein
MEVSMAEQDERKPKYEVCSVVSLRGVASPEMLVVDHYPAAAGERIMAVVVWADGPTLRDMRRDTFHEDTLVLVRPAAVVNELAGKDEERARSLVVAPSGAVTAMKG